MKLIITDDSIIMRSILREALESEGLEVIAEAGNGKKAIELHRELCADVIIMDINMPIMDGLEATKAITEEKPVPIVIFSNEVDPTHSFEALQYGAVEVIQKPDIDAFNNSEYMKNFVNTLKEVAKTHGKIKKGLHTGAGHSKPMSPDHKFDAMVIGASTGGPIAVREVLSGLPAEFPVGIALVQHIEERFATGYAKWLNEETQLYVEMARSSDQFTAGSVKIAPGNRHLVCKNGRLIHDDGPKVGNQKPSVNKLFESAAECFGPRIIGVLLTGMGTDGGQGCLKITQGGGHTIVQNQETSLIYGMPRAAVELGGASVTLALDEIAPYLIELVGSNE